MLVVHHLYISPGHNYRGHHGLPPGEHPILEVDSVMCVAGKGLVGDRYFEEKEDFKGQITFFALEVHRALCAKFGQPETPPAVYRRNVITEGLDLNTLVAKEFELQGVRFLGTEECRPCYWMDRAVAPGAEGVMQGRGGLRAKIITSGTLSRDGAGSTGPLHQLRERHAD
ncbi:MAG: molybdenum cofactor biosysynthesis protein [Phycisphaeraceae bacterium]|nr:molybdenum cofactor biosysynthesis protein [Phycisphaeraceae bacterium]